MAQKHSTHGLRMTTGVRAGMMQGATNIPGNRCTIDNMQCLSEATNDSERNMCAILYDNCIGARPGSSMA